jgi:hypothetical protein
MSEKAAVKNFKDLLVGQQRGLNAMTAQTAAELTQQLDDPGVVTGLTTGNLPDGQKIGKFLCKLVPEGKRDRFNAALSTMLPQLDYGGAVVRLSARPLDILLMSVFGITSCMTATDFYTKHPFTYTLDGSTLIAMAFKPDRVRNQELSGVNIPHSFTKMWRQMVYVNPERNAAWMGYEYPSGNEGFQAVARALMAHAMNLLGGTDLNWVSRSEDGSNVRCDNGLYVDNCGSHIVALHIWEDKRPSGWTFQIGKVAVPCIVCGKDHASGHLYCAKCRHTCCKCGSYVISAAAADGNYYCHACFREAKGAAG